MIDAPAGLYLHVPFCSRVCPYCDFAVRTGNAERRQRYVDHLVREVELYSGHPLRFDTIYFGGGTPSRLDADQLGRILGEVRRHLRFAGDVRIFLEANPEDVTDDLLRSWAGMGVNTLSLGVQSLDPAALRFLGRRHQAGDARRAVGRAIENGFDTVSVDLIYGLPDQTPAAWREEMQRALDLGAHHLSCYQLTIHGRTRFGLLRKRGKLDPLPLDCQADLFRLTHEFLNGAGMQGYEVSQFAAAPRHRSRHNVKYWDHTPYLGLGPSAHSFHRNRRWWNIPRTDPWQERVASGEFPVEDGETLDKADLALESLMIGLRTYAGVDLARLLRRWGVDLLATNRKAIARMESERLVEVRDERLVPTLDGLAVADTLATKLEL